MNSVMTAYFVPPQAEAFAAMVLIDFVTIKGAAQTIMTLLKKPDNRCAAITMLGKTIELCHDQVRCGFWCRVWCAMPIALPHETGGRHQRFGDSEDTVRCCTCQPDLAREIAVVSVSRRPTS